MNINEDLKDKFSECLDEFHGSVKFISRIIKNPLTPAQHKLFLLDAIRKLAADYIIYKTKYDNNDFNDYDVTSLCYKSEHLLLVPDYLQDNNLVQYS